MHPDTTIKQISIQALNRVIFDPLPKPSQFWSLHCNQVISDPPHWNHHGSIPEDFGNRGESTLTNLQTSKKQWQKHRKKGQTTANGTSKVFFYGSGTAVWPWEFYHKNLLLKESGKCRWPYRGSYFLKIKKKTPSFDSPWRDLSYGAFALLWLIYRYFRNCRESTQRRPRKSRLLRPPTQ